MYKINFKLKSYVDSIAETGTTDETQQKREKKNQLEFIFNAEYIKPGRQIYQLIRADQLAFSVAVAWIKHFLIQEKRFVFRAPQCQQSFLLFYSTPLPLI
jgi:hypothetical protein